MFVFQTKRICIPSYELGQFMNGGDSAVVLRSPVIYFSCVEHCYVLFIIVKFVNYFNTYFNTL